MAVVHYTLDLNLLSADFFNHNTRVHYNADETAFGSIHTRCAAVRNQYQFIFGNHND